MKKKKSKAPRLRRETDAITKIFGMNVFNERVMKARLSKADFSAFKNAVEKGISMPPGVADRVAEAMKNWALERGATHYTHWFQPLTGSTAEKHDSFISPTSDGGVIMEFSGKQLIKGEPDASSFPSGGLRATFEARGYTVWDASSPAFLKEDAEGDTTLCIPTAFYSYTGVALDKKIPLLRSMEAVSRQATKLLKALGTKVKSKIVATAGPEQEYFLIDKSLFLQRLDLMMCGRTLFGAPAPKGQELEDHYFGSIKDRISRFMTDLDQELWKMGISSKTRHNEVAPAQFEMAPVFSTVNVATDHNQLVMETMQKVALRHDLVCLLHEKPYAGINGSGKHNNWSLNANSNLNLLEPGKTPHENLQFLLVLSALIMSVDKHADILRASCANSGNDHRLGANEAPPAIISIFLGDELTQILEKIAKGEKSESKADSFIEIGVDSLPKFPRDNTDRNRTSPFAFTGNKFEFRMVGSSMSIAGPNLVLNTIVAEAMDEIASRIEKAPDINKETAVIVKETMEKHGRVIFNGNNYSDEWVKEAEKRGLPNVPRAIDAFKSLITDKSVRLFEKYKVLSESELHSRYEIFLEQYSKQINIEAETSLQMARRMYIPAAVKYADELVDNINKLENIGISHSSQTSTLSELSSLLDSSGANRKTLESETDAAKAIKDAHERAEAYRNKVIPAMNNLRKDIDSIEEIIPSNQWPGPTYADLLFKL